MPTLEKINERTVIKDFSFKNHPVIKAELRYPLISERSAEIFDAIARSDDEYCRRAAEKLWLQKTAIAPCAEKSFTASRKNVITFNSVEKLSFYSKFELTENGYVLKSDLQSFIFDAALGYILIDKRTFYKNERDFLYKAAEYIGTQAENMQKNAEANAAPFFPDVQRRIRAAINAENFFISEGGFTFFFKAGSLAKMSRGVPAFFVPADVFG